MKNKITIKGINKLKGVRIPLPTINNQCTIMDVFTEVEGYVWRYHLRMRIGGAMTSYNDIYTVHCWINRYPNDMGFIEIEYVDRLDGVDRCKRIEVDKKHLNTMEGFVELSEGVLREMIIRWVGNRNIKR